MTAVRFAWARCSRGSGPEPPSYGLIALIHLVVQLGNAAEHCRLTWSSFRNRSKLFWQELSLITGMPKRLPFCSLMVPNRPLAFIHNAVPDVPRNMIRRHRIMIGQSGDSVLPTRCAKFSNMMVFFVTAETPVRIYPMHILCRVMALQASHAPFLNCKRVLQEA